MNKWKRIIFFAAGLGGIACLIAIFLLASISPVGEPKNTIIFGVVSPDERNKAVIFERNSGATTDFSTQIPLLPVSSPPPKGDGNIFISDTWNGRAPSAAWGGPGVKVHWEGPHKLIIEHHMMARIFKAEAQIAGVLIEYRSLNPWLGK